MGVKKIDTLAQFEEELKNAAGLVVVDFFADWCGPCKMISPKIEAMSVEFTEVVFLKVNVDENDETAEKYSISAMPTFKFFKNGNKVGEVVGASEAKVRAEIEKNK